MTDLTTPIAADPSDPGNWREIDRLRRVAESEGRPFDPEDPYNWKGIAAMGAAPTAGVPGITAPTSTPGADTSAADNKRIFDSLAAYLNEMGLGELMQIGADGKPSGWLWDQVTAGIDSQSALQIALEQTPVFQRRYGIITQLRADSAAGKPVRVPSVAEVREYEDTVAGIMRQAGLPTWFYDSYEDMQGLMRSGFSPVELEQRFGETWDRVVNTDPAVRRAYSELYGIEGDAALAAAYLDPGKTKANLERASRAAYTKGMGATVGLSIDKQLAERFADLPKSDAGVFADLTQVSTLAGSGVFTEGATEVDDLTERTGIEAVAFGDGGAANEIERRVLRRQANARSTAGGGILTNTGLTGVGTSGGR